MGLFARLRGTERSAAADAAVDRLRAALPDGWQLAELRQQLFCRRPVKLRVWGATATGPAGQHVLTLSSDEDGVAAVDAVHDVLAGTAATATRWAPPPIEPREEDRDGWALAEPESSDEEAARQEVLDRLPGDRRPMNVDVEPFGGVDIYAVVVQGADRRGLAGVGLSRAEAWRALAARLRGELEESAVWVPVRQEPGGPGSSVPPSGPGR